MAARGLPRANLAVDVELSVVAFRLAQQASAG